MNLKTIKVLLFTLLALTLASFLIGCGVSKPVYFLFTALFAVGYAAVWLLCWRCPFCGGRLGRSDGESCPHCGKSLLAPRGVRAFPKPAANEDPAPRGATARGVPRC